MRNLLAFSWPQVPHQLQDYEWSEWCHGHLFQWPPFLWSSYMRYLWMQPPSYHQIIFNIFFCHCRNTLSKRKQNLGSSQAGFTHQGIAPLPSTQSEHDFHKFGIHPSSVAPGFHFHLAASINPDTGMRSYFNSTQTLNVSHNFSRA